MMEIRLLKKVGLTDLKKWFPTFIDLVCVCGNKKFDFIRIVK